MSVGAGDAAVLDRAEEAGYFREARRGFVHSGTATEEERAAVDLGARLVVDLLGRRPEPGDWTPRSWFVERAAKRAMGILP